MSTVQPEAYLFLIAGGCIILAGLAMLVLRGAEWFADRRNMSSARASSVRSRPLRTSDFAAVSRDDDIETNGETPQRVAEIEQEKILFAETQIALALARLILDDKLKLTDAVKIGMGKKSGEGYQKASRQVKAAIEQLQEPEFPALAEQRSQPSVTRRSA